MTIRPLCRLGAVMLPLLVFAQAPAADPVQTKSALESDPSGWIDLLAEHLKATGLKRGLLLNFGAARLVDGIKRVSLCPLWQGFL